MPYTPPVGTVNLNLTGSYTPPFGTVNLDIGGTGTPSGLIIAARTGGARANAQLAYDPNLLSEICAVIGSGWRDGATATVATRAPWQDAPPALVATRDRAGVSDAVQAELAVVWRDGAKLSQALRPSWAEAERVDAGSSARWGESPRLDASIAQPWADGARVDRSRIERWRDLPALALMTRPGWRDGARIERPRVARWRDGTPIRAIIIARWSLAGYPTNVPNPIKPGGPVFRPPWRTALNLGCPLPGTALRIGRTPCVLIAERTIPVRRSYMSLNSASLVRWPDLTPLPCTSITIETDFDSWCWALSATLLGADAWALVQPNPLACEVLATINGQSWKFLLDVPSTQRSFNSDQVSLKGRSRSAWLHDPYTPSRDFSESNARTMQQLGEAALDNTGWALDWQGADWLVPAGRYNSHNTPIGVLLRLANTTDDGIYTHPIDQIITLQRRWPVASWLLDGETTDLLIPEDAVKTLTQSPVYSAPLNGVYVSGTSHGALALVKISGTDGALQPDEPITNELLCDAAGVAAQQRGLNALSDSGAGFEMDAETLFTPEIGLVRPGLVVSIAGMKGVSRSCKISAAWETDGLKVTQAVGLERREVEQ